MWDSLSINRSRFSIRSTIKNIDINPMIDMHRTAENCARRYVSNFFNIKFYESVTEFDYNVAIIKWY